jgi:hypothetical protein
MLELSGLLDRPYDARRLSDAIMIAITRALFPGGVWPTLSEPEGDADGDPGP